MASQYTKDITQSKVYKQATGQDDKKLVDEVLEGLGMLKNLGNEKVTANMKLLQDQEIFNIQRTKNNLTNLNRFGEYEKDLQTNYNGNLDLYSKAQAKKIIDQRALINFPISDVEKSKLTVTHPDEAYGKTLEVAGADFKKRYLALREGLTNKGIPFQGNVAEGNAFIDEAYQGVFNTTSKENNYRVMEGVKSLFTGQGLNYTSAKDLKRSYDNNIATSTISDITKLNDSFKALYNFDPKIAKEMATVVNNADIRKDVVETALVKKTRVQVDQKTGQKYTLFWAEKDITYTDRKGEPQIETIKTAESRKDDIKLAEVSEVELFSKLIIQTQDSQEAFQALLSDGYTARYAYEALNKDFKVGISNASAQQFRNENAIKLQEGWDAHKKDMWYSTDSLGNESLRTDIKNYINGVKKEDGTLYGRPSDLQFASFDEYKESIAPIKEYINKENRIGPDVAEVDFNLTNSSDWKEYFDSVDGQSDIRDFKDAVISDDQFLNELKTEFNSGDFTRVDANGNYFPVGINNVLSVNNFAKMGLNNVYEKPQAVGFNVNNDKLVFKNTERLPEETPPPPKLEEKTWLQSINDIPYIGRVTEFALGDELDIIDATWLIPGYGLVKVGGKLVAKGATAAAAKIVLGNPKTKKMITKLLDQRKKGTLYGFNNKKAYDGWFSNLSSIEQAIVKATSKNGKAMEYGKFIANFAQIKGAQLAGYVPSMGTTVKWGIPIGTAAVIGNAQTEETETKE